MIPCSVPDLSPVPEGEATATAPRSTPALAQQAERPGCARFRLAGHHNMPGTDRRSVRADSFAQRVTQVWDIAAMQTRRRRRAPFPASAGLRQSGCRDHAFAARGTGRHQAKGSRNPAQDGHRVHDRLVPRKVLLFNAAGDGGGKAAPTQGQGGRSAAPDHGDHPGHVFRVGIGRDAMPKVKDMRPL